MTKLTNGKMTIAQHAYKGPGGGKRKLPVTNGSWNVVKFVLKTLKGQPYYVKDLGSTIEIYW